MVQLGELCIHTESATQLERLSAAMPHALLISGPSGIGLKTIASALAKGSTHAFVQPTDAKGNVAPDGTISVEAIRSLYDQTRAKQTHRTTVIIDDADRMSHSAQSAFLKLLEEPVPHVCFILTSHNPSGFLPTIMSRVQHFTLRPITGEQTTEFMKQLGAIDATKQAQLRYLAGGRPAELIRLMQNDERFTLLAGIIGDARTMIQGAPYEKALVVQKYKNDRTGALQLVDSMITMLHATVRQKPQHNLVDRLQKLLTIREGLEKNFSVSLQLMQYVL
ncbi:MAG TPA: AAA family ATPase [Candidatus Saccharimonadales bacterium]